MKKSITKEGILQSIGDKGMKFGVSVPLVSYLTMSLLVVYGVYIAVQPRVITLFVDGHFAPHVIQRCRGLLTPDFLQKHSSHDLLHCIKSNVIGIATCSIRYGGFQTAHVSIKGLAPFIKMNQNLVLTTAGTVVPASEFQEIILDRLPRVKMDDPTISEAHTVADFFTFMQALPEQLFENYAIVWRDKTTIYLIDQALPSVALVALYTTRFTPELMQAIAQLKEPLFKEAMNKKDRVVRKKIIDVRVKGQIIVRHMQGGDYESTSGEKYYNGN
jgi:hypothetical protein